MSTTSTATIAAPAAVAAITAACKTLNLAGVADVAGPLGDAAARQRHTRYLSEVLTYECEQRDDRRRARRIKEAKFPGPKRLEDFDVS